DAAAPQLDAGVDVLLLAGIDEGVPATRAGAEQSDLAVEVGLPAHPLHGSRGVTDHLGIGNATVGAHLGGDVVGIGVAAAALLALVKVGADRKVSMVGKAPSRLDIELAPAGQVVDQH